MANGRKPYTKRESKALAKIKLGEIDKIKKHATKYGRTYDAVYQRIRHASLENSVQAATSVPSKAAPKNPADIIAVPAAKGANIVPYEFEEGADMGSRSEADVVKDQLRPMLEKMEIYDPRGTRHSITIPAHKVSMIRSWLSSDAELKKKSFTISGIPDNRKMSRIFRKG